MDIRTIDHLEIYAQDAEEAAARFCAGYGFTVLGRGGPATGLPDCTSVLLRQHEITLVVTSPLSAAHRAHDYLLQHGEGVSVVGLAVGDASAAFAEAVGRGATPLAPPQVLDGVTFASVDGFGDVEHRFVSRRDPAGLFAPGIIAEYPGVDTATGLLRDVDHLAVCVPAGDLDPLTSRLGRIFELDQTFEERIVVGTQAMESKVVQSRSGGVTFTIIEPDTERAPGQIDTFIRDHDGVGVQHVAFRTDDIVAGVGFSAQRGVPFLTTPASYYDALPARLGEVGVPVQLLRAFSILADRDYAGVMLQIFTASTHPRRTLFYELIERRGARTFGSNNIKALYEAVERERVSEPAAVPGA
ncbi:4-hydroxyphenylpyruvate dioxygenase [Actinoplanes cyaneus]|uniref:4-hydroxyphenylpyruvate dioxygenase n=1 Tax=Actinoplanes cyaneus TaxID=52696 RepID=A0A919IQP5_9ACTN|nr:4-hydroxyphenylpyruvate dioxygenase [Actinoplanes cyaneus]MCW2142219.1 4-hydroxyphenylpyruvate dioxygenase [Actinoplanes cyaneus]GID69236.1 4-hydroxyphenylpyruvate dioxygenase [Actinoplanes cyaneus]